MRILAFDTATAAVSVAVLDGAAVLFAETRPMERGHAEALAPMVGAALDAAGLEATAVDRIAVTRGPGSFTGVRVGLAFARGLALALDRPVVAPTTLAVLAAAVADPRGPIVAVLDTKRGTVYRQAFAATGESLAEPDVRPPESADDGLPPGLAVHLAGDCADRVAAALAGRPTLGIATARPDPVALARLAGRPDARLERAPAPLYIGRPQAVPAAHGGRLRA